MSKKRLLIIDSNSVLHRAFHALPPLTTKKGKPVSAIYGFLLIFFKAIKELQPDYIAACFDVPFPTFRHEKFKAYKATRPKIPDELCEQIPKMKEILKTFRIQIFEKKGFEADDIIGTISKLVQKKQIIPEIETIILSGDLDNLQMIDSRTKVYALKKGVKETMIYNEKIIQEKYGIQPSQLIDFKALKGDPSDNIPGVPGVGEKTAIALIKEFKTLENLYKELERKAEKIKSKLRKILKDYRGQAFLSKELVKIKKDVLIEFSLKKCSFQEYDKEKIVKMFENLDFYSLINRLPEPKEKSRETGRELRLW